MTPTFVSLFLRCLWLVLLAASACLAIGLVGCARTSVYSPAGRLVLRTSADGTGVSYTGPGFAFRSETLDHSTPTLAQGKATSDKLTAAGTAVAAAAASGLMGGLK